MIHFQITYRKGITTCHMSVSWIVDFTSCPYDGEPEHVKIGCLNINGYSFKVLLNPTDQLRALRLIVRTNHSDAIDRSFSEIKLEIHEAQTIANIICARMLQLVGAKNVNVRFDGNNKFAEKSEREGLHFHILGRFDHNARVLDCFNIDYQMGTKGDIALGTNKKPLSDDTKDNVLILYPS